MESTNHDLNRTSANELKATRQELLAKFVGLKAQVIDKVGLIEKIQTTIAHLEQTPAERGRPLYSNLIEFAEIHPTKLRVGVIAPALSKKATGTEGAGSGQISNFQDSEPRNRLKLATRVGSTTVTNGARDWT